MNTNPYWRAYKIRRRHQQRERGWFLAWIRLLPAAVALFVLAAAAEPVWLSFTESPVDDWRDGMQGALFRLGLLIVGMQSLRVYGALIRGDERLVLTLLPVVPGTVALYQVKRVAREGLWIALAAGVMLLPVMVQ